jgi:type VI secretion system protein VasG
MLPDISREFLNRMMDGTPIAGVAVGAADGGFMYTFA